ncbi:endonuclease domain-containing protein [Phenylobacterium sp.]|jgi:very-short-patch-repair endonuclease|uniref:endonuclease domain-containing protein n=1 Tax=Phenylobacterium sp. TaxID=1871053 RepID=UPI002F959570
MGRIRTLRDRTPRDRARALRREDTSAEARLWGALQDRRLGGWKWKRQVPISPFIVDFYCAEAQLVVELDGGHHSETEAYDARRTEWLAAQGLRVIRFWNFQVLEDRGAVCDAILDSCGGEAEGPWPANGGSPLHEPPLTPPSPRKREEE